MAAPTFFQSLPPLQPAAAQPQRRAQLIEMASHLAKQCFDPSGKWVFPENSPDARERIWLCFALMLGSADDIALANAILADTRFQQHHPPRNEEQKAHPFDIFVSNHAVQMVVLHADKLTLPVREKIENWARMALNEYPGDRQADFQFHGYNDNMPAKACMGMILGGEYFNDAEAVKQGLWSLRQLRDMFTRRGLISEFNSPTYSPLSVANLSEIARYSKNEEARVLASQCAERVWADVLGHFHPGTGMTSGPFSRAYTTDSAGHLSNLNFMLWLTFGDGVFPNPLEELRREPPRLVLHHAGDLFFVVAQCCWFASFEYEPPEYLAQWLKSRKYPFHLTATAERGEGDERLWSAGEMLTTTYQEPDFALGTSEGDWGMQAEELFFQYRLHDPARGARDARTAFTRYLVNDDRPGDPRPNHNALFVGEHDFLPDHGRYHTVQHERVAMLLASPHLGLIDQPVTRLGLALILPEHLSDVEKLEVSDGHVWLRDGLVYLALRPLGATDWGRRDAVRIEKANRYRMVWLANYEGPERTFTRDELIATCNGYVVAAGSAREESFDDFRKKILDSEVLDYYYIGTRTVRCRIGKLQMGINYGTLSGQARFVTLNGKPVARPIWQADGLPAERLPFLGSEPIPNTLELPYKHLKSIWTPNEKWQIFSRGAARGENSQSQIDP